MILCVNSSPRTQATEHVLGKTKNLLKDKGLKPEMINLRDKKINFCKHCDYCLDNKECVLEDDMAKINELLEQADGVILATPVYNSGISA